MPSVTLMMAVACCWDGLPGRRKYSVNMKSSSLALSHAFCLTGKRFAGTATCPPLATCPALIGRPLALQNWLRVRFDAIQGFAEIDGLLVFGQNLDHGTTALGGDFVKHFHRFDDADDRVFADH